MCLLYDVFQLTVEQRSVYESASVYQCLCTFRVYPFSVSKITLLEISKTSHATSQVRNHDPVLEPQLIPK